jgi:hypothetical protein
VLGASSSSLQVSFTAPASPCAITYQLCWSLTAGDCGDPNGTWVTMQTSAATSTTIAGLSARTPYNVWVRTVDSTGAVSTPAAAAAVRTLYSFVGDVIPVLNRCTNSACHGQGAIVVPTNYNVLLATEGGAQRATMTCPNLVVADGNPMTSFIYAITQAPQAICGSSRMGEQLAGDAATIAAWLTDGAPNDGP